MNRRLLFVFAVLLAIFLPLMLVGQDKKGGGEKKGGMDKKDAMAASASITGCFNKGKDATHYVIKDDKGKETVVTGDAATLDRHANNHNVTLTGTMDKGELKATELKMNSMCK